MKTDCDLKCRLCLEDSVESADMFDLFHKESGKKGELNSKTPQLFTLYEKIEYCCGVRIRKSTEMPSKICLKCFDMTRVWFNFRQMVLNSQVYLESLCTDQEVQTEFKKDETKYINYLLEDLQKINRHIVVSNDQDLIDKSFVEEIESDDVVSDLESVEIKYGLEDLTEEVLKELTTDKIDENYENKKENLTALNSKKTPNQNGQNSKYNKKRLQKPSQPSSYICTICGNIYEKKHVFQYHMKTHKPFKPHQCEICNKSFRLVSQLKCHMRRHTGEKPYQCSFCDRRFVDHSERLRHERVHKNSRPYKCEICEKTFTYSATLKNHSKLHTGKKDFHCLVCNKSFALQHQMKAHLQTMAHRQKESQLTEAGYEVIYE